MSRPFLLCLALAAAARAEIVGDGGASTYLDGADWVATSNAGTIRATVPGDLVTDLQVAGLAGDPLYEMNWIRDAHLWADNSWTYSKSFTLTPAAVAAAAAGDLLLVFDGVKMSSAVSLNGVSLGGTTDQYLRYVFSLKGKVAAGANVLTVTFDPTVADTEGRWMACSGGWECVQTRTTLRAPAAPRNCDPNTQNPNPTARPLPLTN